MNTLISMEGFACILFGFVLLITIHELGHWLFARFYNFKTPVFSVGFGTKYWVIGKKFDTEFRLSAIPFGGYVAIPEMEDESSNGEELSHKKPAYQRILVSLAGPLFNILLSVMIGWAIFAWYGKPYIEYHSLQIQAINQESPSAKSASLKPGDIINSINDHSIETIEDLRESLSTNNGKAVSIALIRDKKPLTFLVKASKDGKLGVVLKPLGERKFKHMPIDLALIESVNQNTAMFVEISKAFSELFMQIVPFNQSNEKATSDNNGDAEFAGPIGIFQMGIEAFKSGGYNYWFFLMVISTNLAVLNLLPLPVLDGGHILLNLVELARGNPLSTTIRYKLITLSGALLLGLMLWLTASELIGLT